MQPLLVQPEVTDLDAVAWTVRDFSKKFDVSVSQAFGMLLDNCPKVHDHLEQMNAYHKPANSCGKAMKRKRAAS